MAKLEIKNYPPLWGGNRKTQYAFIFTLHKIMKAFSLRTDITLSDPIFLFPTFFLIFNPFKSIFCATRILPSSYLFWAGKRLVDYL
jgi:hypothetical protein